MRRLQGAFDGTVEGSVHQRLDLTIRQIDAARLRAQDLHSYLDRSRGIELLSELLALPSADQAKVN